MCTLFNVFFLEWNIKIPAKLFDEWVIENKSSIGLIIGLPKKNYLVTFYEIKLHEIIINIFSNKCHRFFSLPISSIFEQVV